MKFYYRNSWATSLVRSSIKVTIRFIDIGFLFFLFNTDENELIDKSFPSEIHAVLSSTDKWFVFVDFSFFVEHLHVGILSDVKNRSV
jgi:hypothetical protein